MKNWMDMLLRSPEGETGGSEPAAEAPAAEAPAPEAPGEGDAGVLSGEIAAPKAEEPKAEEPKAEEPKAEEPKAEEPKAEEPKAEEPKPADAVPGEGESYEFTVPEGMEFDTALAEAAQPVFKELGLTRAQADRLVALVAERQTASADEMVASYRETQAKYLADAKADAEIGQGNWEASTKKANQALQKFGTPGLIAALREHGLANHPEMIRAWARVGSKTVDDTLDTGGHVDTSIAPPEERWYGATTSTTKKV